MYIFSKLFCLSYFRFFRIENTSKRSTPLYVLAIFTIAINCFVETSFAAERYDIPKYQSFSFYNGDRLFESSIFLTAPVSFSVNKPFNFAEYGASKSISSTGMPSALTNINSPPQGNERNEEGDKVASVLYEYLFEHGFIGFLAWIILWPYLFKT